MRTTKGWFVAATVLAAFLTGAPGAARAQSVLERTPNLSGGWVGEKGTVRFHFLHRFWLVNTDPADNDTDDKIVNSPTFFLSVPLPGSTLLGVSYASNSLVTPGEFNEFELMGRWAPLRVANGSPLDLAVTGAYNGAAESGDAELSASLPVGPARLLGSARYFSDAFGSGESRWALGGGAAIRLTDNLAIAGDAVVLTDRDEDAGERVAWGAAIQTRIPTTPHTFSIQASNTPTGSMQGSTRGDRTRWGFEFTIPFTLSRYFGRGGAPSREEAPPAGADVVEVTMTNTLAYEAPVVRIQVGQTVVWRNTSVLIHTVTADPAKATNPENVRLPSGVVPFDSGEMQPGDVFTRTFDVPGEYLYFCIPHELAGMVGRVIVEG